MNLKEEMIHTKNVVKVNGRSEATSVDRLLNPCTYMCGMNQITGSIKNWIDWELGNMYT